MNIYEKEAYGEMKSFLKERDSIKRRQTKKTLDELEYYYM